MSDNNQAEENVYVRVVTKKVKALRKKLANMDKAEKALSEGVIIQDEQIEMLKAQPVTKKLLEEFEQVHSALITIAGEEKKEKDAVPPPPEPKEAPEFRLLQLLHVHNRFPTLMKEVGVEENIHEHISFLYSAFTGQTYVDQLHYIP
jgi:hypothetical protein